jgi:hypothetical protein
MTENKMTIGQMIDHLGLDMPSIQMEGILFSSDDTEVMPSGDGRGFMASWEGVWCRFDSLDSALRWLCEKKDNDLQMHRWKVDEYRQLWVRIATSDGRSTFVKSAAATPWTGWKTPEGVPHPTDEQLDDLVRNDPILGLICWQMWGITPKEEA